jgi:hypothetical protein
MWFFNKKDYIEYTHFYRWQLPDKNIYIFPSSYPGQLPYDNMPWEIMYFVSPPCSSRGCQSHSLDEVMEMFGLTIEEASRRNKK